MMKLISAIAIAALLIPATALAQFQYGHRPHHNHHQPQRHHQHQNIIAPLIIGGLVGYALSESRRLEPPPVYITPEPNPYYIPQPTVVWREVVFYDYNCSCYRRELQPFSQ